MKCLQCNDGLKYADREGVVICQTCLTKWTYVKTNLPTGTQFARMGRKLGDHSEKVSQEIPSPLEDFGLDVVDEEYEIDTREEYKEEDNSVIWYPITMLG